jgi:hypothetical protein
VGRPAFPPRPALSPGRGGLHHDVQYFCSSSFDLFSVDSKALSEESADNISVYVLSDDENSAVAEPSLLEALNTCGKGSRGFRGKIYLVRTEHVEDFDVPNREKLFFNSFVILQLEYCVPTPFLAVYAPFDCVATRQWSFSVAESCRSTLASLRELSTHSNPTLLVNLLLLHQLVDLANELGKYYDQKARSVPTRATIASCSDTQTASIPCSEKK